MQMWICFHIQEDEIACYSDLNCISDYPYKNEDSNQSYSSLDECNYFFNNICYENCPNSKISLSIKSKEIKNYYLNILSLN